MVLNSERQLVEKSFLLFAIALPALAQSLSYPVDIHRHSYLIGNGFFQGVASELLDPSYSYLKPETRLSCIRRTFRSYPTGHPMDVIPDNRARFNFYINLDHMWHLNFGSGSTPTAVTTTEDLKKGGTQAHITPEPFPKPRRMKSDIPNV